jgi:hypothetical protein
MSPERSRVESVRTVRVIRPAGDERAKLAVWGTAKFARSAWPGRRASVPGCWVPPRPRLAVRRPAAARGAGERPRRRRGCGLGRAVFGAWPCARVHNCGVGVCCASRPHCGTYGGSHCGVDPGGASRPQLSTPARVTGQGPGGPRGTAIPPACVLFTGAVQAPAPRPPPTDDDPSSRNHAKTGPVVDCRGARARDRSITSSIDIVPAPFAGTRTAAHGQHPHTRSR